MICLLVRPRRARVTVIRVLVMTRFRGRLTFRIMNHAEGPVRMDHPPPSPVNRPRSRTPPGRRRADTEQAVPTKLDIANRVVRPHSKPSRTAP